MKKLLLIILTLLTGLGLQAQKLSQSHWQQEVSYEIDVELDDENHQINAQLKLQYTNNSPDALEELYIHLWPNAYASDQTDFARQQLGNGKTTFHYSEPEERGALTALNFKVNNLEVRHEFSQNKEVAKVILNEPLASGASLILETPFSVDIPQVFSRLGRDGQDYYMTQWFPKPAVYDVNGWNVMPYLDQGEFYSEFGRFVVRINLPQNYVLTATGTTSDEGELAFNQERKEYPLKLPKDSVPPSSLDRKTVEYRAENVHDFAWFASKNFNIKESSVQIDGREVTTRVVGYEPAALHLNHIGTALEFYSENVGPYPYPHATVVNGKLKAGGGMEYPMITLIDVMSEEVIIHEVGHNWFYGILANNERVYPWMDESINSFYDGMARASEGSISSGGLQENVMNFLVKDNLLTSEHQAIGGHSAEFTYMNYGLSVYGMGAIAFKHLYAYLGEERFDQAMMAYYEKWKFKHPLPEDMKTSFEASTSEDLSWFFDDLLNADKALDYAISRRAGNIYLKNKGAVAAPMPVVFTRAEETKTVWARANPGESVLVESPFEDYEQVIVDLDGNTSDFFAQNDALRKVDRIKLGTGRDHKAERETFVLPALAWNAYDKWMAGLVVHNYTFSNKRFNYHLLPLYSFNNKQLNGLAHLQWTKPLAGNASYLEAGVDAQKFSWSPIGFREYGYLKFQPYVNIHLPKSSMRSPVEKTISLQYIRTAFDPNFDLEADRQASFNPNYSSLEPWQFFVASYRLKNERSLNPYSFWVEIEHGRTSTRIYEGMRDTAISGQDTMISFPKIGERVNKSDHTKISARLTLNPDIGIKNKPLRIRLFAAYLIEGPEDGYFKLPITYTGNRSMYADYRFDELSMHRNAGEGMFRNQIQTRGANSRFVGVLGQSDRLLANAIITVPLPGKIPIKPYAEVMTFTDIDQAFWNDNQTSLIYNVGLELTVIPSIFTVYFNIAQSNDIVSAQENIGIDKFTERITFSLNLNDLSPTKIKKRIKLF